MTTWHYLHPHDSDKPTFARKCRLRVQPEAKARNEHLFHDVYRQPAEGPDASRPLLHQATDRRDLCCGALLGNGWLRSPPTGSSVQKRPTLPCLTRTPALRAIDRGTGIQPRCTAATYPAYARRTRTPSDLKKRRHISAALGFIHRTLPLSATASTHPAATTCACVMISTGSPPRSSAQSGKGDWPELDPFNIAIRRS